MATRSPTPGTPARRWHPVSSCRGGVAIDTAGDVFIADNNGRVQEIAASSHTQFGVTMTAGDIYTVAGGGTGALGGPAIGAGIGGADVTGSPSTQPGTSTSRQIPASSKSPPARAPSGGSPMTADDIYAVAGNGTYGHSGDGGRATSAELSMPTGLAFDSAGDLYIGDEGNSRVQEVAAHSGTQWGVSMTADDIYTVAGSSSGAYGRLGKRRRRHLGAPRPPHGRRARLSGRPLHRR